MATTRNPDATRESLSSGWNLLLGEGLKPYLER